MQALKITELTLTVVSVVTYVVYYPYMVLRRLTRIEDRVARTSDTLSILIYLEASILAVLLTVVFCAVIVSLVRLI